MFILEIVAKIFNFFTVADDKTARMVIIGLVIVAIAAATLPMIVRALLAELTPLQTLRLLGGL